MKRSFITMPFDEFRAIFQTHLDKIRNSPTGDRETKFFRSPSGYPDNLHDIPIITGSGQSESRYFIAHLHAEDGKEYPVYCKVFNTIDNYEDMIGGLLSESCVSVNNINQTPLIPTLTRNYGVLAGSLPESSNYYTDLSKTNFIPHGDWERPMYIFNEYYRLVEDDLTELETTGSAMSLYDFIEITKTDFVLGNNIFKLVYRTLLTIKEMHKRGLYHNDLHCRNILVVRNDDGEYDVRIFDWDFGFSVFPCMPPPEYQKTWCGDGNGCYEERDYWDILRLFTSIPISKNQLSKILPGNQKLLNDIYKAMNAKDSTEFYNNLTKVGNEIRSVDDILDAFNPDFIPKMDKLFKESSEDDDIEIDDLVKIINEVQGDEFEPDHDARKLLKKITKHLMKRFRGFDPKSPFKNIVNIPASIPNIRLMEIYGDFLDAINSELKAYIMTVLYVMLWRSSDKLRYGKSIITKDKLIEGFYGDRYLTYVDEMLFGKKFSDFL